MGTRDPRIDAYIAKQQDFAKPILTRIRVVVHAASPEAQETLKWSTPHFQYRGGMMCAMAAFKEHAIFGFWKGALIEGVSPNRNNGGEAMGNFGRLTSVKDMPSRTVMMSLVRQAMRLNDEGISVPKPKKAPKPEATMPDALAAALDQNRRAAGQFQKFSPSQRREYIEWIDDAKRDDTRVKRITQAIEWIADGKGRNWKYEK